MVLNSGLQDQTPEGTQGPSVIIYKFEEMMNTL